METQQPQNLPNANIVLVLGIVSIIICWWHLVSLIGIILAVVTLILAAKDLALYRSNPAFYTIASVNNIKAGRICALIGLTISIIVFFIVMMVIIGILAAIPFWGMIE